MNQPIAINTKVIIALRIFLEEHEGRVDWMYRDRKKGLIHTGIGFNIHNKATAISFRWKRPKTKSNPEHSASHKEVRTEWDRIFKMKFGTNFGADFFKNEYFKIYKQPTLRLQPGEIERKFKQMAERRYRSLRKVFTKTTTSSGFDAFPADAQMAMLVHSWAFEPSILKSKWKNYYAACKESKWLDAHKQSHWKGMSQKRYEGMRQMFMNAQRVQQANEKSSRYSVSTLYYPGFFKP
jgi:hypothetical protein